MLTNFLVVLQILSGLAIVGLVLVQHGKGADMGASFGAGASGSLFGATGSANFLSRSTAGCALVFFSCTLILALLASQGPTSGSGESVLDRPAPAITEPAATTPADLIPGAKPSPATTSPATNGAAASPEAAAPSPKEGTIAPSPEAATPPSVTGSTPAGK